VSQEASRPRSGATVATDAVVEAAPGKTPKSKTANSGLADLSRGTHRATRADREKIDGSRAGD
jgi:hypothetical protein